MKKSRPFLLLELFPPTWMLLGLGVPVLVALVPLWIKTPPLPWLGSAFLLCVISCMFAMRRVAEFALEQVQVERSRTERDMDSQGILLSRKLLDELAGRDKRTQALSQQMEALQATLQQVIPQVSQFEKEQASVKAELGKRLARLSGRIGELGDQLLNKVDALDSPIAQLAEGQTEASARIGGLEDCMAELDKELAKEHRKTRSRLEVLQALVEGISEANREKTLQMKQDLADHRRELDSASQSVQELGSMVDKELELLQDYIGSVVQSKGRVINTKLAKVKKDFTSIVDGQQVALEEAHKELHEYIDSVVQSQARTRNSKLTELKKDLTLAIDEQQVVLARSNIGNYAHLYSHSRMMSESDLEQLEQFWLPVLKLDLSRQAIGYIAHKVCSLEDRCAGRLAASVQDSLLRILLARSLGGRPLRLLEIGSLFGIALAAVYDNCRGFHPSTKLVAVDPMDGFYMTGNDRISGMPVAADLFLHNMQTTAVPQTDFHLVQHLSTDSQAFEAVKEYQFDILVIDGDHSYAGVQFDFDTYGPLVRHGGLVLFDDYNQQNWPEVTKFVDEHVRDRGGWKLVGADWHSIVFRRTGRKSPKKQTS